MVLLDVAGRVKSMKTAKQMISTAKNVMVRAFTAAVPSLHLDGMVEQVEAKRNAGSFQALGELGHDAGGVEAAFDVAAWPQSELLEQVNVLQAYHFATGPGNLADMSDAPCAVDRKSVM